MLKWHEKHAIVPLRRLLFKYINADKKVRVAESMAPRKRHVLYATHRSLVIAQAVTMLQIQQHVELHEIVLEQRLRATQAAETSSLRTTTGGQPWLQW
jgi:hypothetical protein